MNHNFKKLLDLSSWDEIDPVIREIFTEADIDFFDIIKKLNYTLVDRPKIDRKTYLEFLRSVLVNSLSGSESIPTLYTDRPEYILPYLLITLSIFGLPLIVVDISNIKQIEKSNEYANFSIPMHIFKNLECIESTEDVWQSDLRNGHFDLPRDRRYGSLKKSVLLNKLENITIGSARRINVMENEKYDLIDGIFRLRKRFNSFLYIHSSGLESDQLRFFIEGLLKHRILSMGLKIPINSKIITNFKQRNNYYSGMAICI